MYDMSATITPDTRAVLALCAHLGGLGHAANPLSNKEYQALACWLRERGLRPADLFCTEVQEQLRDHPLGDRIRALLDRHNAVAIAVEAWTQRGVWILSRADAAYPLGWRRRLRDKAPPLLFGVGNRDLLQAQAVAIVGSREADGEALAFAGALGRDVATSGRAVVSGAAKGVDHAAMTAALGVGG
ncbi:MAG: DNA-processing protein DprA, partial [Planctomycetota bacterium]